MLSAASRFAAADLSSPIYITCTADEEIGYGGASQVAQRSELFREMVAGNTRGIIGEPTMLEVVYAHKGTFGFHAISHGKAAHSSTREGINANLRMIPFLAEMKELYEESESDLAWRNDEFDPPTVSWNIGINDHTKAVNITPPQSICTVYFRPMPGLEPEKLMQRARDSAERHGLEFVPRGSARPMYVDPNSDFINECLELAGKPKPRTVAYGTDGAMFGELSQLVVLGPGDIAQAHTHDEWIELEQLELGTELYARAIRNWCTKG
jgi:acetylornithine deacetylase